MTTLAWVDDCVAEYAEQLAGSGHTEDERRRELDYYREGLLKEIRDELFADWLAKQRIQQLVEQVGAELQSGATVLVNSRNAD